MLDRPPIHLNRSHLPQPIGCRPLQLHRPELAAPTLLHPLLVLGLYTDPLALEGQKSLLFIRIA